MSSNKTRRSLRTRRIWPIATIAALSVAAMAFALSARNDDRAGANANAGSSHASDAVTLGAEHTAGTEFNANRLTPVFTRFSGRVVSLAVGVGTSVREGQPLAMLDSSEVVGMETDFQAALTAARAARISHDQSVLTRDRATRLADVDAIARRELQEAQALETRAAEDLQQADAKLAAARGRLQSAGFGDVDIERLESRGTQSITRLVPLRAPVAGTITERRVGLGQNIQPGGDALLKIASSAR